MKWKTIILIMLSAFLIAPWTVAQKNKRIKKSTISGFVKDRENQPINNAIIKISDSDAIKFTNAKGYYELKIDSPIDKIMVITPLNGSTEINYDGETALDFIFPVTSLKPSEIDTSQCSEDELVDLGYVSRKPSDVTNNILTINGCKVNPNKYRSVLEMIRGETPGAYVPSNQALFIIDGAYVYGGRYFLNSIEPEQVKSISVLTGAAKVAYGSQGFYGVVILNRKSAINNNNINK